MGACGIDTNSVAYSGGKLVGSVAGQAALTAACGAVLPGVPISGAGWQTSLLKGAIAGSQTYVQSYRESARSGLSFNNSVNNAVCHSAITFFTQAGTHQVLEGHALARMKLPENTKSKLVVNAAMHATAEYAHQSSDKMFGMRKDISTGSILTAGVVAGAGVILKEKSDAIKTKAGAAAEKVFKSPLVQKVASGIGNRINNMKNAVGETAFGKAAGPAINKVGSLAGKAFNKASEKISNIKVGRQTLGDIANKTAKSTVDEFLDDPSGGRDSGTMSFVSDVGSKFGGGN